MDDDSKIYDELNRLAFRDRMPHLGVRGGEFYEHIREIFQNEPRYEQVIRRCLTAAGIPEEDFEPAIWLYRCHGVCTMLQILPRDSSDWLQIPIIQAIKLRLWEGTAHYEALFDAKARELGVTRIDLAERAGSKLHSDVARVIAEAVLRDLEAPTLDFVPQPES